MKKRIVTLALSVVMVLAMMPQAYAATTLSVSGDKTLSKLSQREIIELLEKSPVSNAPVTFTTQPSINAPYSAGQVAWSELDAATGRLNALRRIAGLPSVTLDSEYTRVAQYGATLLAAIGEGLGHDPQKPAGMSTDFYNTAYRGVADSNLYAGGTLTSAVDGFMNDPGIQNLPSVGHRRWQLNPSMTRVGFGYATGGKWGQYITEKVIGDTSGKVTYDFIAWPASGNFPNTVFGKDVAWSVSVNPSLYTIPQKAAVKVTLTRQVDGKVWTFGGKSYTPADSGLYFNVDTEDYAINNCIVFRPDGIETYEGTYTVSITGVKSKGGADVVISYQVDFFGISNITPPEILNGDDTNTVEAIRSNQRLTIDGVEVECEKYAINGNNYFKLRDLAYLLNGSGSSFGLWWNESKRSVMININAPYYPDGSELTQGGPSSGTGTVKATVSNQPVIINGITHNELTVYTIHGNNFFKLRELGDVLGFGVDWEDSTRTVKISTALG